jgi:hypothetical protein
MPSPHRDCLEHHADTRTVNARCTVLTTVNIYDSDALLFSTEDSNHVCKSPTLKTGMPKLCGDTIVAPTGSHSLTVTITGGYIDHLNHLALHLVYTLSKPPWTLLFLLY